MTKYMIIKCASCKYETTGFYDTSNIICPNCGSKDMCYPDTRVAQLTDVTDLICRFIKEGDNTLFKKMIRNCRISIDSFKPFVSSRDFAEKLLSRSYRMCVAYYNQDTCFINAEDNLYDWLVIDVHTGKYQKHHFFLNSLWEYYSFTCSTCKRKFIGFYQMDTFTCPCGGYEFNDIVVPELKDQIDRWVLLGKRHIYAKYLYETGFTRDSFTKCYNPKDLTEKISVKGINEGDSFYVSNICLIKMPGDNDNFLVIKEDQSYCEASIKKYLEDDSMGHYLHMIRQIAKRDMKQEYARLRRNNFQEE